MIGALESSVSPDPGSLPELVPAPDCFSASAGVVSPPAATGLLLVEPALTALLFPVAGEPSFCATTEGSTGSTTAAAGLDFSVVGVTVSASLLPGSYAFTPLLGSALATALVEAAIGDCKVAAGDGVAIAACGSGFESGVGAGARAVASCSTRGGSKTPKLTGVQVLLPQVFHTGSISVTSGGKAS